MSKPSFGPIWRQIVICAGQEFKTVSGLPFTYAARGQVLRVNQTRYNLPRSEFERAYALAPLKGPGQISSIIWGPEYIYAVLTDARISPPPAAPATEA
jgi:hypothetical protein